MLEPRKHSILDIIRYRFNLDEDKEDESKIVRTITKNVEFRGINLWTLIFAILIASIGLNVNSVSVIIGAMLISPMMGPVMGIGLGAGIFDFALIKKALKNLAIAALISITTSACYFCLSPLHEAGSELLAGTRPTIWDVLVALFGGMAGIIASSRKNISNIIPGVAIATALMPPLCTAGYGIGTGNFYYFAGAFYLFLINSVFISIATFLMVRFLKFKHAVPVDEGTGVRMRRIIWCIALLTILPSIYLAYRFVRQEIFRQNANAFIAGEIRSRHLYVIDKSISPLQNKIGLILYGEDAHDTVTAHILANRGKYGLGDAELSLDYTMDENRSVGESSLPEEKLAERDKRIQQLTEQVRRLGAERYELDTVLYREFAALYGKPEAFSAHKALVASPQRTDTVLLVYYSVPRAARVNRKQLESWLKAKYPHIGITIVTH